MIDLTTKNATAKRTQRLAASLLGVVAGIIAIVVERADMLATSGSFQLLGYVNTYTWLLVSALLFGVWGAILTTEIQALIGLITMTNPALSWLWPFVNLIFALGVGVVVIGFSKLRPNTRIGTKLIAMSSVCALLDIPLVYFVIVIVLELSFVAYSAMLPVYMVLQLVPSTFLAYLLVKALKRSKVFYNSEKNESDYKP